MHFVPFPRLVLPTASPLFLPGRSSRLQMLLPSRLSAHRRVASKSSPKAFPTLPAPPTQPAGASRWRDWVTQEACLSTSLRSVVPRGCPPERTYRRSEDDPSSLAQEDTSVYAPTARQISGVRFFSRLCHFTCLSQSTSLLFAKLDF